MVIKLNEERSKEKWTLMAQISAGDVNVIFNVV